jgi:hypothetical protein
VGRWIIKLWEGEGKNYWSVIQLKTSNSLVHCDTDHKAIKTLIITNLLDWFLRKSG